MSYSFHPSHIVHMAKAILFVLVFGSLIFLIRGIFGDFFLPIEGGIITIGIIFAAIKYAQGQSYTVTIEDRDITYAYGIVSTKKFILPIDKITEANFSQNLVQKIFGLGTLDVDTPGGTNMVLQLPDVKMADIQKIVDLVDEKA